MARTGIRNNEQLRAAIAPALEKAVEYIVEQILKVNEEIVWETVYQAYDPSVYERTGQFQTAWRTDVIGDGQGNVLGALEYDPTKISAGPQESGQHISVLTGEPSAEYLVDIIYGGLAGNLFGEGPWTQKRNAYEALVKELGKKNMLSIIDEGLRKAGLTFKAHRNVGLKVENNEQYNGD